jgi:hypothetical protein
VRASGVLSFALLTLTLNGLGCSRVEFEVDPISLSTELLNQRRYPEAIEVLTSLQAESPENQTDSRIRILLASALAGSVGVDAIELFDILGERFFKDPLIDTIALGDIYSKDPVLPQPESTVTSRPEDAEELPNQDEFSSSSPGKIFQRSLIEASKITYEALDVLFRIPYTPKKDRPRLNRAMSELRMVTKDDPRYKSARLYLALMDIVQFSNKIRDILKDGIDERVFSGSFLKQWACKLKPAQVLPSIYDLSFYLEEAFRSLDLAGIATVSQGFKSLNRAVPALHQFNHWYLSNSSTVELAVLGHQAAKESYCNVL